jgi:putative ubiquitin-RnfH superfamily antitoxin RatB of RatAB toxin-antitoxin module
MVIEYSGEIRPLSTNLDVLNKLKLEKQPVGIKFFFGKPMKRDRGANHDGSIEIYSSWRPLQGDHRKRIARQR